MKKFKKLIPAFCMLMVSAVLLGTSTYAWFSMNGEVKATGMTVSAKTDTKFLVISANSDLDGKTTELNSVTHTGGIGTNSTQVYPCAKADVEMTLAGVTVGSGKWYTANSKVYDNAASVETGENDSNENISNVKILDENNMKGYHLVYTFYIALENGTYNGELKFTNVGSNTWNSAVKAIVKVGNTEVGTLTNGTNEVVLSSSNITTSATTVTVTFYVDGNDSTVKGNTANITGNLDLKITATGITADTVPSGN